MKHKAIWAGVLAISASMLLFSVQPVSAMTVSGFTVSLGCTSYDWSDASWTADRDNTGNLLEAGDVQVTDGAGKVLIELSTWAQLGSGTLGAGSANYTRLPDYNPLTYRWISRAENGFDEQTIHFATGMCAGLPTYMGPGPDMVLIPDTAVVGTFTDWTPLHFSPHADSASSHTMAPGQSLYVFGMDAAGQFYQVLLSGNMFWVPVSNLRPTYDEVWNGRPLPVDVVE